MSLVKAFLLVGSISILPITACAQTNIGTTKTVEANQIHEDAGLEKKNGSAKTTNVNTATWLLVYKNGTTVTLENVEIFNLQPPIPNANIAFSRRDPRTGRTYPVALDSKGRRGVEENEIIGYFRLK